MSKAKTEERLEQLYQKVKGRLGSMAELREELEKTKAKLEETTSKYKEAQSQIQTIQGLLSDHGYGSIEDVVGALESSEKDLSAARKSLEEAQNYRGRIEDCLHTQGLSSFDELVKEYESATEQVETLRERVEELEGSVKTGWEEVAGKFIHLCRTRFPKYLAEHMEDKKAGQLTKPVKSAFSDFEKDIKEGKIKFDFELPDVPEPYDDSREKELEERLSLYTALGTVEELQQVLAAFNMKQTSDSSRGVNPTTLLRGAHKREVLCGVGKLNEENMRLLWRYSKALSSLSEGLTPEQERNELANKGLKKEEIQEGERIWRILRDTESPLQEMIENYVDLKQQVEKKRQELGGVSWSLKSMEPRQPGEKPKTSENGKKVLVKRPAPTVSVEDRMAQGLEMTGQKRGRWGRKKGESKKGKN